MMLNDCNLHVSNTLPLSQACAEQKAGVINSRNASYYTQVLSQFYTCHCYGWMTVTLSQGI